MIFDAYSLELEKIRCSNGCGRFSGVNALVVRLMQLHARGNSLVRL